MNESESIMRIEHILETFLDDQKKENDRFRNDLLKDFKNIFLSVGIDPDNYIENQSFFSFLRGLYLTQKTAKDTFIKWAVIGILGFSVIAFGSHYKDQQYIYDKRLEQLEEIIKNK